MKKKFLAMLMCLALALSMMPSAAFAVETDVTEIATVADLKAFAEQVNAGDNFAGKTVKLTADLTFENGDYWYYNTDGMETPASYVIQNFAGTFDGQGHTISNMQYFNSDTVKSFNDKVRMGLFGVLKGGTVRNVTIDGATATLRNNNQIGFLIKTVAAGAVENCHVKNSTVTCDARTAYTGGLIGDIGAEAKLTGAVTVANCSVDKVTIICDATATYVAKDGPDMIGGFVGGAYGNSSYGVTISGCTATDVTLDIAYKSKRCGGFIGYAGNINVGECKAENVIVQVDEYYQSFGGFAGVSAGATFTECDVAGFDMTGAGGGDVGGFCAYTSTGSSAFDSCSVSNLDVGLEYNGDSGFDVGGFLGYLGADNGVELSGCTVAGDITVTGESTSMKVGELVGDTYSRTVTLADSTTTNVTVEAKEEVITNVTEKLIADVNGTYFSSLQAAINAAEAGQTIKLLQDIGLSNWTSVDVKKAIVLDGNGKTITGLTAPLVSNASVDFEIKNLTISGANIEVKSAEGLDNDTSAAALVQWANGGTLTLNNVSVMNSTIKGDGYVAALVGFVDSTSKGVIINGGTVSGNTLTAGGVVGAAAALTYADVTVDGVTVSANALASTSDGGTRPDKVGLVVGRPVADTVSVSAAVDASNTAEPVNGTAVVIGSLSGGNAVITGGSYPVDPTVTAKADQAASVKEGFEIAKNDDGTYGVQEAPAAPAAELVNMGTTLELEGMILIDQFAGIDIEGYDQAYIEANGGLLVWTADPEDNATYENREQLYEGLDYYESLGAYYGQSGGIASKMYADEYYLCVYLKLKDGTYIYTSVVEYSVQKYCKTVIDGNYDAKYQTLCCEMLEYGAAAQLAFGYNTNDLADAILKKD